jgi:hypothetical protein
MKAGKIRRAGRITLQQCKAAEHSKAIKKGFGLG